MRYFRTKFTLLGGETWTISKWIKYGPFNRSCHATIIVASNNIAEAKAQMVLFVKQPILFRDRSIKIICCSKDETKIRFIAEG